MSKYTTELRFICESLAGETESQEYSEVDDIIEEAAPKIFSFDFPLFDNSYRSELTQKIIRHYYTREIGFETYGLFKLKLQTKMNEIMPYYNQLYESALLELEPLGNYGFRKTSQGTTTDTNTTTHSNTGSTASTTTNETATENTTETEGEAWNKFSDTPQGGVTGLDNDNYLTNATKNTDTRSGTGSSTSDSETTMSGSSTDQGTQTSNGSGTNNYVEDLIGYSGISQAELLQKFRETFLNIDMMVIEDLEELFFQLW